MNIENRRNNSEYIKECSFFNVSLFNHIYEYLI